MSDQIPSVRIAAHLDSGPKEIRGSGTASTTRFNLSRRRFDSRRSSDSTLMKGASPNRIGGDRCSSSARFVAP